VVEGVVVSTVIEPGSDRESETDRSRHAAELLAAALEEIARRRGLPVATYRVQLHAGFRFSDALAMVPYLAGLGITDCYASPYLKAAPGSVHGYDITDHAVLNPEIGTREEHDTWLSALHENGLGLVLDVVPNHMGILGNENRWWNDVLENGQASLFARHFDIDWAAATRHENRGRILLPFLGDLFGAVLERGELKLVQEGGVFHVQYHEHCFPLDPRSYRIVLERAVEPVTAALGADHEAVMEFQSILTGIRNLPEHTETDTGRIAERHREKEVLKRRIAAVMEAQPLIATAISGVLDELNGTPGDPRSFDTLDELLAAQPYRLAYWRVAPDEINYRRFFDVNTLAAIRTEREEVFRASHSLVLDIVARQKATGLRIDHPDGLLDPETYFHRLQEAFVLAIARWCHEQGPQAEAMPWDEIEPEVRSLLARRKEDNPENPLLYVVVEKILGLEEPYPEGWRTHGTSGYDALNRINGIFVDPTSAAEFTRRYQEWIDDRTPYADLVRQKKLLILEVSLASELHVLAYQLERIALRDRRSRDFTQSSLRQALREVIASFPVYRSYITAHGVSERDRALVDRAVRAAIRRNPLASRAIFLFLRNVLLDRVETPEALPEEEPRPADLAGKFQQVTAPVMAKGLEDTAFYVYNRLVSLNEVGGEPDHFGYSPDALHRWNIERARRFPYALTPLSTHDTKRSEDVRARINVLSEIPGRWFEAVERWHSMNEGHRIAVEDREAPDLNEEYAFYQNLLGAWPLETLDAKGFETFRDRMRAYMAKAIHEAKVNSTWMNPDPDYDDAIDRFVASVLDQERNRAFLEDFQQLQRFVSHYGQINSLAQTLVKIAMPGVPDTYQGTELWDFSLVDPDNRRPVDYELRASLLKELEIACAAPSSPDKLVRDLLARSDDGRIKLYTHWRAFAARKQDPSLFTTGDYQPLAASGKHASSVFAFLRANGSRTALIAVPRLSTKLVAVGRFPLGEDVWHDTVLQIGPLPHAITLQDVFTGRRIDLPAEASSLPAREIFAGFPVALLVG
jgi:(1->4)-alpha-D-glucan 1-alpha-D-glucosylmutase